MSPKHIFILSVIGSLLLSAGFLLGGNRDQTPPPPAVYTEPTDRQTDSALVHQLLEENLQHRQFPFAAIVEATSGKHVVPLDDSETHRTVKNAIEAALEKSLKTLSAQDSPVRQLRRINEASRYFEDVLHASINTTPGLRCDVPPNRRGEAQRSGYPDLKITHLASGTVFYLDPKLVEQGSWNSTLRTFYFEPKNQTLKINDDAIHLLCGIEHDGHDGEWKFISWKLVDLSKLQVRLKAEFQASNAEVYSSGKK
jgi:hypothetical protein